MRPEGFLADLEAKPAALAALAEHLEAGLVQDALAPLRGQDIRRVVCAGMGSSRFAAAPEMARLRAAGVDAYAEYASARDRHPGGPDTLVVGISATGGSPETITALAERAPGTPRLAITNGQGAIRSAADAVLDLHAGEEVGGVACRTFQHTLLLVRVLGDLLRWWRDPAGSPFADEADLVAHAVARTRSVARATSTLLEDRDRWLPPLVELCAASPATFLLAPVERLSSAEQGALMLREGPRRQADACETGDWSHVDVYLAKPLDYRAIVFAGSAHEPAALDWLRRRDARWAAVSGDVEDAALTIRYPGDHDPDVAIATEVLVPELLAAHWWHAQG